MCIGHKQLFHIILVQRLHAFDSLSASVLGLKGIVRHPLDVPKLRHSDHNILFRDQVFHGYIKFIKSDRSSSFISIFIPDSNDLFLDHAKQKLPVCQDRLQTADLLHQLFVFCFQLFSFQTGQSAQTHIYNSLCLNVCQFEPLHQFRLGNLHCSGSTDNTDHFIDMIQSNQQTFQDMSPFFCFIQLVFCPTRDNLFLMLQVMIQHFQDIHNLGLIIDKSQHDDSEGILELRMFV